MFYPKAPPFTLLDPGYRRGCPVPSVAGTGLELGSTDSKSDPQSLQNLSKLGLSHTVRQFDPLYPGSLDIVLSPFSHPCSVCLSVCVSYSQPVVWDSSHNTPCSRAPPVTNPFSLNKLCHTFSPQNLFPNLPIAVSAHSLGLSFDLEQPALLLWLFVSLSGVASRLCCRKEALPFASLSS